MSEKKAKQKRIGIIAGISVGVVGVVVVISLIASGAGAALLTTQERVVKSGVDSEVLMSIKIDFAKGNLICMPSSGNNGWLFYELADIDEDVLASKLQVDIFVSENSF